MVILVHFVVYLICFAAPVFTLFIHRRLKNKPSNKNKESAFGMVYLLYGLIFLFIFSTRPLSESINAPNISLPWWVLIIGIIYTIYYVFSNAVTIWGLHKRPEFRKSVAKSFEQKAFMFPTTNLQIKMFYGISIIVGIVEELFFRGFMMRYLMDSPYGFSWPVATIALAILFGVGHFPQGWHAVLSSGINGLLYWFLFAWSGSIWLPAVVHILYDARIGYMSKIIRHKNSIGDM